MQLTGETVAIAIRRLHLLVNDWLFVASDWPPQGADVNRALERLGLEVHVNGRTFRTSKLGKAVDVDIWRLWCGGWETCEGLLLMQSRGFCTLDDVGRCFDQLEAGKDIDLELRLMLKASYFKHFGQRLLKQAAETP
jgi:hypothetical protein